MKKRRLSPLNAVLADIDERKHPNGLIKTFSIAFITKSGKYVYIHRAIKAGLKKNLQHKDFKAIQAIDAKGNNIGHVYPVWIHAIVMYSGNIQFKI